MKLAVCLVLALLLPGCGKPETEEPCQWLSEEIGGPGDTLVTLSPLSFVKLSNAGGAAASIRVREGFTAFRERTPGCVASPEAPCSYELEGLRLTLNGFSIGDVQIRDYSLLLRGPVLLEDRGGGLDLQAAGTPSACARIDDALVEAELVELSQGAAMIDSATQGFTLDLGYDARFELDETPVVDEIVGAPHVDLSGALSAAGEQPWAVR